MARISNRQCRQARAILKWNQQDLACKTHISARRVEDFERGALCLMQPEMAELVDVFQKAGLVFKGENEVALSKRFSAGVSTTGVAPTRTSNTGTDQIVRVDVTDEVLKQAEEERLGDDERVDGVKRAKRRPGADRF